MATGITFNHDGKAYEATLEKVDFKKIIARWSDNLRTQSASHVLTLRMTLEADRGIRTPLVGIQAPKGNVTVLAGFHRHAAIALMFTNSPDIANKYYSTLPMFVFSQLPPKARIAFMGDNASRLNLDAFGVYNSIRAEVRYSTNNYTIAAHLGAAILENDPAARVKLEKKLAGITVDKDRYRITGEFFRGFIQPRVLAVLYLSDADESAFTNSLLGVRHDDVWVPTLSDVKALTSEKAGTRCENKAKPSAKYLTLRQTLIDGAEVKKQEAAAVAEAKESRPNLENTAKAVKSQTLRELLDYLSGNNSSYDIETLDVRLGRLDVLDGALVNIPNEDVRVFALYASGISERDNTKEMCDALDSIKKNKRTKRSA